MVDTCLFQFFWHTIEPFSYGTCNAGQSVAIAAQRYRSADNVFKRFAFQERSNSLWDGFLAGLHMEVAGADLIAGSTQIISTLALNVYFDLRFGVTGSSKENSRCGGFCSLDTFGMIMRHHSGEPCHSANHIQVIKEPSHRRYTHSGSVTVASIGFGIRTS